MSETRQGPSVRLLPNDFQKWVKSQEKLDDTPKCPEALPRLFQVPESLVGKTDHGIRKFLVFYFDNDEDYDLVLQEFIIGKRGLSHPMLDSAKLARMVKQAREKGK